MPCLACRVALLLVATARAHFIWLRRDASTRKGIATFGELAGVPGADELLALVEKKTSVLTAWGNASVPLTLSHKKLDQGRAQLEIALPLEPPFLLELRCVFGIFSHGPVPSLLKYYASADAVTMPNDWFGVQDVATAQLEVTLRDPYMGGADSASLGARASKSADQCPRGQAWYQGDACVVAVVRYKQALPSFAMKLTTFAANGSAYGVTSLSPSDRGVVIVKLPPSGISYASVNYRELRSGTFEGKPYQLIDHWATTSLLLQRAPS